MCGICGFVGNGSGAVLHDMMDRLAHRGPDADGHYIDRELRAFLGHRRLSVLDVEGGAQPMWNEDEQVGVVFNGEIYNHDELRQKLQQLGHVFQSDHSDTEVLVHGYEQWGADLPVKLNGMFAFAVLDRRHHRLFLARDRFGEKPLFYTQQNGVFAFASELTALGAHPDVDTRSDPRSVKKFLLHGFIPAPNSLWRNTHKLPPGSSLTFDLIGKRAVVADYWKFHIEPSAEFERASEAELADELGRLLRQAVHRRLVSDVPLGVFLSGGIDSSALLAYAAEVIPSQSLQTFSIGFFEASFDESTHARAMAKHIGSQHHERMLGLVDAKDLLSTVLRRLDEPLGDPSILPTYLLAGFARSQITVAISGDGSDELFAGYDPFRALSLARFYSQVVPRRLHEGVRRLADLLPISARNMSLDFKLRRTLRGLSYDSSLWNAVWLGPLEPRELAELTQEPVDLADLYGESFEVWNDCRTGSLVDRTLEFYTRMYLTNDILVKSDRASMLNSLEVRTPFLDNDLVDFARRLPAHYKCRRGATKYLLKRALEKVLPSFILKRKKKGFGIPLGAWLRNWPEHELVGASLGGAGRPASWNDAWRARRWEEHRSGHQDNRLFLWADLALRYHSGDGGVAEQITRAA